MIMIPLRAFTPALTYTLAFALFMVALCACITLVERIGLKSMARNTAGAVVFFAVVAGAVVLVTGDAAALKTLGPSAAHFLGTVRELASRFFS